MGYLSPDSQSPKKGAAKPLSGITGFCVHPFLPQFTPDSKKYILSPSSNDLHA